LQGLRQSGALTEEEFVVEKQRILQSPEKEYSQTVDG